MFMVKRIIELFHRSPVYHSIRENNFRAAKWHPFSYFSIFHERHRFAKNSKNGCKIIRWIVS